MIIPIDRLPNRQFGNYLRVVWDLGCRAHVRGADVAGAASLYIQITKVSQYIGGLVVRQVGWIDVGLKVGGWLTPAE